MNNRDDNLTHPSEGPKIIERVCQAVKEVHLCISTPGGSKHYESCVAARLIYWLDCVFFYGLKKQHKGYWPVVSKTACKSTLDSLSRLEYVTTPSGKGRAWLLLSLNEGILEALLATLEVQTQLLAKYYHPYALLRDSATFQILITLVSGLEHVGFDFPVDALYLNTGILDSTFAKYVTEFEPVDAPLNNIVVEDSQAASLPSPKRVNSDLISTSSPNPIMNSPMVKRRSHLRGSAVGSSNSLTTQKRVSFYSNDSDIVETSDSSEDRNKSRGSLQRYKSEWILGRDDALSERNESRRSQNRHLRRFQSELQLNRSEVIQQRDPMHGLERGAPEGQEDPDRFNSLRNLNWLKSTEEFGKKTQQKTWNNSTLTKYALTLLTSMKSSFEAQKPSLEEERKRELFRLARQKAFGDNLTLPLPAELLPLERVTSLNCDVDRELSIPHCETAETRLCQVIVNTLGLSNAENYKLFHGYLELYSGKFRHVNVLVGRKAIYITLGTSHSLFWSAALFDIISVKVKSSYTQLCLESIVSTVTVDFVDTSTARLCASYLDLYLNTLSSSTSTGCAVSVETATELCRRWKPWLVTQTNNQEEGLDYLGAVFWEEVVLTSILNDGSSVLGPYKSGYLMFAWNKSRSWQPGYFVIKAGVLYQFSTGQEKVPIFMLPLSGDHCKGYGRNFLSSRPHTIEIQVDKRKNLLLAAASESEASDWLSTISYSSAVWDEHRDVDDGAGPVNIAPCGVLISTGSVILFREKGGTRRRITSSFIEGISAVGISSDVKDHFCTVEFTCREASEGEGDWVFYFLTADEMDRFVTALKCPTQILSEDIAASLRRRNLAFSS